MDLKQVINVGIDLDGVCSDFCKRFSQVANQLYGDRCWILDNYEKVIAWDWTQWYPMTKDEINGCWKAVEQIDNFWVSLEPMDFNQFQSMKNKLLNQPNVNVYFITARHPSIGLSIVKQSILWLENLGWQNPQVIEIGDKGPALKALKIHHFIDDKIENIESALLYSDAMCYAFDVAHNKALENIEWVAKSPRYVRVKSLSEFTQKVLGL